MQNPTSSRSFWERPEGTTGKVLIGMAGIGAAIGLYKVLPWLITLAENMIYLSFLVGVLIAIYMLVTSERVKTMIFYAFQMLSRAITSNFVDIDPVAILKSFAQQMRKKGEEVESSIKRVMGVKRALEDEITRSQKELTHALKLADVAEKHGDEDALNVQAEKAGRRDANIKEYQNMRLIVDEILEALTRVSKRVQYHIANSEDEMNELIRKNQIAIATRDATNSANAVLGDSDLLEIRNMAADRIRERYSNALGELDGLIQMSKNMDKEIDLNTLVFRSDGRAKLAELRKTLNRVESGAPITASARVLTAGPAQEIDTKSTNRWAQRLKRPD